MRRGRLIAGFFLSVLCPLAAIAADYRETGFNHFYNLEYDQAVEDFSKLVEQNPDDPIAYNSLAAAQLYQELYRLGLLESSALRGDNQFLNEKRPEPDPRAKAAFENTLDRGHRVADKLLAKNSRNEMALYSLGTNHALRANYDFMVDKAWFSALRNGSKAHDYCEQLRKANPNLVDAYLVLGVYDYVVGSLPGPVKLLAAIGGMRGNKDRGEAYVERVAVEGKAARNDARVLLIILYRRERRPLDAARMLEGLMADFPRNYVFGLELASMYSDAGKKDLAIETFQSLLKKADAKAPGYDRLPKDAVKRKLDKLQNG